MFRIGYGVDFHRFSRNRRLVLGGVQIPSEIGLEGHSDADVILHAVCDALLGAAGLGDIGLYFPDSDPEFKDIQSSELLKKTFNLVLSKKFRVVNVDLTLILQTPKISLYKEEMKKNISSILNCDAVNIKATTPENLGALGRGEGAECRAVVLLESIP